MLREQAFAVSMRRVPSRPWVWRRVATFNARVEAVTTKSFFREPFKKKRCLMPVSGYQGCLPSVVPCETGNRLKSCAMIITEPNDFVTEVHDRMSVLLRPEQFADWLSGNIGVKELKPVENDYLQRLAVSKRVNSSKADGNDPTLIDAVKQVA